MKPIISPLCLTGLHDLRPEVQPRQAAAPLPGMWQGPLLQLLLREVQPAIPGGQGSQSLQALQRNLREVSWTAGHIWKHGCAG